MIEAVSTPDLQSMVDSLPGEKSAFLPHNSLVDSGAEISVCFDYNQFCEIRQSDVDQCMPVGSEPLDILGKGTIRFCAGTYVDFESISRSIDLEIEDVHWIPQRPINLLATESLRAQNMYLYTGPRGNELTIPGFADQEYGRHGNIDQKADSNGNPTLVFCLGDGRPVWRTSPVDSGVTWMEQSTILHQAQEHREIAAVQEPKGVQYMPDGFLTHLMYGHCEDAALRIARAPDLYGKGLTPMGVDDHRLECEGSHCAGHVKQNQGLGLRQGQLTGRVDKHGASLHAAIAGPVVPMGISGVNHVLAVVDEWSLFAWMFPMKKKSQPARLLALLVPPINTQVRKPGESGVKRLHTDQGGEFKSHLLEEFCQWKGIVHTFTDRAQHEANGLVERKIGMLKEAIRAALLTSDLPAYLWPEVYMAMCHTQNLVPSSALQRERRKAIKRQEEYEQEEMNLAAEADAAGQEDTAGGQGTSDQGEPGVFRRRRKQRHQRHRYMIWSRI